MKTQDRNDVAKLWKGIIERAVLHPLLDAGRYLLYITSGTSGGEPILSLRAVEPIEWDARRHVQCIGLLCVRFKYVQRLLFDTGTVPRRILALDATDIGPGLDELLADFDVDGMLGAPSMILHAAEHMASQTRSRVRTISLGGERVRQDVTQALQQQFPHAQRVAMYNVTELGSVARPPCGFLPAGQYHPAPGRIIELLDPEDGIGDILISMPIFADISVRRYRTGDLGRLIERQCQCGSPVTFEIIGRRGLDYIKVPGGLIRREEWDRVALSLKRYDDYRLDVTIIVRNGRAMGRAVLRIFCRKGVGTEALAEEIARQVSSAVFVTPSQTYADLVAQRHLEPLRVEFVAAPFPDGHKDVKLVER